MRLLNRIKNGQIEDNECELIIELLKKCEYKDYMISNDLLYRFKDGNYLLKLPKPMQKEINVHEQGHIGAGKV